jgi:hypothetical protein
MGKHALTQIHPASWSAQPDDVIPTMLPDILGLRGGDNRYTYREHELTEGQFGYVQGRFRR